VSSRAGNLSKFSEPLQVKLLSPSLTVEELSNLISEFIESVEDDSYSVKGFPKTAYGVSKVGVNALTQVLARKEEYISRGILINACCPGWVRTGLLFLLSIVIL
jgi:carbonyl reductase 1